MSNFVWNIKLYFKIIFMNYKSRIKYHGNREFFHALGMFLSQASEVFIIWISMSLFKSLGGFNFYEVMFLFSIELLAYSLANSLVWFSGYTYDLIIRGKLDDYLTRPANPFLLISARYFEMGYIGQIAISITLLFVALGNLSISWDINKWLMYLIIIICSTIIYIGFTTIPSLLSFWWGNTEKLTSIFRWSFKGVLRYPLNIYPDPVRVFLTVIPYGFINYYPTLVLLNKTTMLNSIIILLSLVILSVLIIIIIKLMWFKGIKKYESAGG